MAGYIRQRRPVSTQERQSQIDRAITSFAECLVRINPELNKSPDDFDRNVSAVSDELRKLFPDRKE